MKPTCCDGRAANVVGAALSTTGEKVKSECCLSSKLLRVLSLWLSFVLSLSLSASRSSSLVLSPSLSVVLVLVLVLALALV